MTIFEQLDWKEHALPAEAAFGQIPLQIGQTGDRGPKITILAGVHGDEGPWGALAIQAALEHPLSDLSGRVQVILAANPLAASADARNAPLDQLDLNRVFPGKADGSHTERLAAVLAAQLEDSDIVVDLHGGGSWCVNAFTFRFPGGEALADMIGAPFVVDIEPRPGGLTNHAREHGAKILAVEMGGRCRDELIWRDRIAEGLTRIMQREEIIATTLAVPEPDSPKPVTDMQVLRPSHGGLFMPSVREEAIGTVVEGDRVLGTVLNLHTLEPIETLRAPYNETALLLLRPHICRLEGGAMTYVIARPTS